MQQLQYKQNLNLQNLKEKYEAAVRVIPTMAKKFGVNLDPYTTAYAALGIAYGAFKMNDLINTFKNHYIFQPRTSEDGTIYYVSEDPQTGTIKNVYSFKPNLTQLTQITSAKAFSDQHARDEAKRIDGVGSGGRGGRGGASGGRKMVSIKVPPLLAKKYGYINSDGVDLLSLTGQQINIWAWKNPDGTITPIPLNELENLPNPAMKEYNKGKKPSYGDLKKLMCDIYPEGCK